MYWDSSLKQKWDNENVMQYAIQQAVDHTKETTLKQIAKKAKAAGVLLEIIAKCTSLSVAEIEKL